MIECKRISILITGAYGFLGSHAISFLRNYDFQIFPTDIINSKIGEAVHKSLGIKDVEVYISKLNSKKYWLSIIKKTNPDIIMHLAGTTGRDDIERQWSKCLNGNLIPIISLVEGLEELPFEKRPVLIYPGTQMEYGISKLPWKENKICMPINAYGSSKLAATKIISSMVFSDFAKACVVRFPIIFGPAQFSSMFIPSLIINIILKKSFEMTKGFQIRRLIFVEDAIKIMVDIGLKIYMNKKFPSILNSPALDPISIRKLAQIISSLMKSKNILKMGAIPYRNKESMKAYPDDTLANKMNLKIETSLIEGLKKTLDWYKKNKWFYRSNV